MAVATACSVLADSAAAFAETYDRVHERLGGDPDLLLLYHTTEHDGAALRAATGALPPGVRVMGSTTCFGLLSEEGTFIGTHVLGLLGLRTPGISAGAGLAAKGADPAAAARRALLAALDEADRPGETPDLVLLSSTAGDEEAVLAGIASVVGPAVPVWGGTAGGPRLGGASCGDDLGRVFGRVAVRGADATDAVALAAVFAPTPIARSFHNGCVPTAFSGAITATDAPRVIRSIDGEQAADVYSRWIESHTGAPVEGDAFDLMPLGREIGRIGAYPMYALTHVAARRGDGALAVMTDVAEGEEVRLMIGAWESIAARPARAVEAAIGLQAPDADRVSGAMIAFCAGMLPRIAPEIEMVQHSVRTAMRGHPFLGAFTFGEQGCLAGERSVHGNLMISTVVFGERR